MVKIMTICREELPPIQDLKELILKGHQEDELLRIRAGQDGCGCLTCQAFYETIDLAVFGARVKRYDGIISIEAGRTGADLWGIYHPDDLLSPAGNVLPNEGVVSKIKSEGLHGEAGILKQERRGRPRKDGKISRVTAWRRKKELKHEF